MVKKFLLVCLLALGGCAGKGYVEVGAGIKEPGKTAGHSPTALFNVGYEINDSLRCEYHHISHWLDGFPFNNNEEFTMEQLVCYKRIRF